MERCCSKDDTSRGMKIVLQEHGFDTEKIKAADMRLILGNHRDFGHRMLYIPKFHCELNPIERVWGAAKCYSRSHCDYSFQGLDKVLIPVLGVCEDTIRKYFRKCREYMQAYSDGKSGGSDVENAVKLYKSHHRVFGKVD